MDHFQSIFVGRRPVEAIYRASTMLYNWSPGKAFGPKSAGIDMGGFNPADGRLFQDAAGTIRAAAPGDPVGLVRRAAGSVDASQSVALSRAILGRHPKSGLRNLLRWTEDFGNSAWTKPAGTVASGLSFRDSDVSAVYTLRQVFGSKPPIGNYMISFEFKAFGPVIGFSIVCLATGSRTTAQRINALTGEVLAGTGVAFPSSCVITPLADGWKRAEMVVSPDATVDYWDIRLSNTWPFGNLGAQYTGDGTGGLDLRNIQFEAGNIATPYQRVGNSYDVTEGQKRRNLLFWSEDMSNALWSKSNASVSGDKIIESTDNTSHAVLQSIKTTNAAHTLSGEFQADGRSKVRLQFGTPARYAFFDLSTGGVSGMPAGATATITPLADGWWRCQVSGVVDAAFSSAIIYLSPATNTGAYPGDGVSGVRARNLQFEEGNNATPYQKVTTGYDDFGGIPSVWYLQSDGIDDFLVTPNLDWSTDEMTISVVMTPLGPSTSGLIASTTSELSTLPGSWFLQPWRNSNPPQFRARGTIAADVYAKSQTAFNNAAILSARAKISEPMISLKVNGGEDSQLVTDMGTGNFAANRPLCIFARDNVNNYIACRLYDFMLIDRKLQDSELARIESFFSEKYGIAISNPLRIAALSPDGSALVSPSGGLLIRSA